MTGAVLVQGVVWRDEPCLRVRHDVDEPSQLVPVADYRLGYRIGDRPSRTCVGHVPFRSGRGDYVDCINSPQDGSRVCLRCAIVEATFASNLHHAHTRGSAELDPAIREHLDQPNRLYLAGFRDGSTKVGTSTLGRAERRLREQGAWTARFVAETANGRAVRVLEDAVTEQLGVAQSVSAARKKRGLVAPVADMTLDARLDDLAARVLTDVIGPTRLPSVIALDTTWVNPHAGTTLVDTVLDYPLRVDRGRHDLEIITAIGRLLLVRRPGGEDTFVVDPAPLFGLWLELGDFGSDEIAIQDALF